MIWGDGFEIETVINCRIAAAGLRHRRGAAASSCSACHGESNLNAVSDGLRVLKTIGSERRRAARLKAQRRENARERAAEYKSRSRESRKSA